MTPAQQILPLLYWSMKRIVLVFIPFGSIFCFGEMQYHFRTAGREQIWPKAGEGQSALNHDGATGRDGSHNTAAD